MIPQPDLPEQSEPPSAPPPAPQRPLGSPAQLDFGAILARSFSLIRHNPVPLLLVAGLMPFVAQFLLDALALISQTAFEVQLEHYGASFGSSVAFPAPMLLTSFVVTLLSYTAILLLQLLAQGFVLSNLHAASLGFKASTSTIWQRLRPVVGRFALLGLLLGLIATGFVVILAVLVVAIVSLAMLTLGPELGVLAAIPLGLLVSSGALVPMVWLNTKLSLSGGVLLFEGLSVGHALRRSWRLVTGRFWKVLGVQLALGAIIAVPTLVLLLLAVLVTAFTDPWATALLSLTLSAPAYLVSSLGSVPLNNAVGLLYLDARAYEHAQAAA